MTTRRRRTVTINRAPVLTLWAAVVAERLGFRRAEALSLGKTLAGLNAQSKGRRLGLFTPGKDGSPKKRRDALRRGETITVDLLHRAIPARETDDGILAVNRDRVVTPESVKKYLDGKFGDALGDVREAMTELAKSRTRAEIAEEAYELYEAFRPEIPAGQRGWGAAGKLDLALIRKMAR